MNRVSSIHKVVNSSFTSSQPRSKLQDLLRPPKANQTLKKYLESHSATRAIVFFRELWRQNPSAVDSYSSLYVVKACTQESLIVEGRQLHATVKKVGFESVIYLQTCLIELYSKMGDVGCSHRIFDEVCCKNAICWTSLITAYIDNNMASEALAIFKQMVISKFEPDQVTLTVALASCADLGALSIGEQIHAYTYRKHGLKIDLCLYNALIDMYVKCGQIRAARRLFCISGKKDVFTWTSMIVGHALHGQSLEALGMFARMKQIRSSDKGSKSFVLPNDVTFLGVLMACSHGGMVMEGKQYFKSMMEDYGLWPRLAHLGCMVDLFCRAGLLEEAYDFISGTLVQPNALMWRILLGACCNHGNIELGAKVRLQLLNLDPTHVGDDVTLSNMYAGRGLWYEKMMVRDRIECRRVPGCSSVEVASEVNEFVAGDTHHPLKAEIYNVLEHLMGIVRSSDHIPDPSDISNYCKIQNIYHQTMTL
uniref:Pentatricopeptide repeat-containing protein n=2 Tax=Chenopodium quinoa TaxID=63459 RepID=A0A803L9A5_CHEQI